MKKMLSKSQTLLYIYDLLIRKGNISKNEIKERCLISDLTFRRYIVELRDYLEKMSSPMTIEYSSKNKCYYFVKKKM